MAGKTTEGKYCDVYDGKVWKDFMTVEGVPFLSAPFNFALQLNVNWFQPFKHTQHSEGVIYLSILNLPREDRFLKKNILLVGIIPGPKKPALHMNTFLQPLVNELKQLWEGGGSVCEHSQQNLYNYSCCTNLCGV